MLFHLMILILLMMLFHFNDIDSFNGVVSINDIDSSSDKNYFVVNLFSWMKFYLKMIFTNVNQR